MTTDYRKRLIVDADTKSDLVLKDKCGNVVAYGYERIVIGGRGPYVEVHLDDLNRELLYIPYVAEWRMGNVNAYYEEMRTHDEANVKVYIQKRCVDYADYRVGFAYISPFELYVDKDNTGVYEALITPIR